MRCVLWVPQKYWAVLTSFFSAWFSFSFFCSYQGFLFCCLRKHNAIFRLQSYFVSKQCPRLNLVAILLLLLFISVKMSSSEIIFIKNFHLVFYHLSLNDDFLELLTVFFVFCFFNFQCFLLRIVCNFRKHEFIKIFQQFMTYSKWEHWCFTKEYNWILRQS